MSGGACAHEKSMRSDSLIAREQLQGHTLASQRVIGQAASARTVRRALAAAAFMKSVICIFQVSSNDTFTSSLLSQVDVFFCFGPPL